MLEDPFEQLFGIVKNVDRHGKPALFLIMTDSCLKIIQAKIKVVRRRKSVNNATISYTLLAAYTQTAYKDSRAADCLVGGISRIAVCSNGIVMADFSATAPLIDGKVETVGRYLNPTFSV